MSKVATRLQNFQKIWTTPYSLFSVWLFGQEQTRGLKEATGMGFETILLSVEDGLATIFKNEEENQRFAHFLAERSFSLPELPEQVANRARQIKVAFEKLLEAEDSEVLTKNFYERFISLHVELPQYFLTPLWAPNAFETVNVESSKKTSVYQLYANARKEAEHLYPDTIEYIAKRFFRLIASKENRDSYLLSCLLPEELEAYLGGKALPSDTVLAERNHYAVVVASQKGMELLTGSKARSLVEEIAQVQDNIKSIKGLLVTKGIVCGKVRVIFRNEDMKKFMPGDILVTTMTRPDWLPAMKIASAYVTDAGGILCHAAIVARELKKPCIIGTKVATKVLKDGDLVEVDAGKGIVNLIARSE